jgi:hypothetical protein
MDDQQIGSRFHALAEACIFSTQPPPPPQWVLASVSLQIKLPERGTFSSPPSRITEVKNSWSCNATPAYTFMACKLGFKVEQG